MFGGAALDCSELEKLLDVVLDIFNVLLGDSKLLVKKDFVLRKVDVVLVGLRLSQIVSVF